MYSKLNNKYILINSVKIMELAVHMKNNKTGEKRIKKVNKLFE